jgi:septum formation topological specificity factor MinE
MSGPTTLDEGDLTRTWPNRWSISRRGLEVVVHVLRRGGPDEVQQLREDLLDAFRMEGPEVE